MEKCRRWGKSLTGRMVIVLILLILPFNIASVVSTVIAIGNARRQALTSLENLASLTMQQLDSRLSAMNDFFYNLDQIQPEFKLYKEQGERDVSIAMAEVKIANYFNAIVENKAFADALYWDSTAYDRFYIGLDSLDNEICGMNAACKAALKEFLETDEKSNYSRWGIAEIGDTKWLLKTYVHNGFYYGSLISLDEVEYLLRESSAFSDMEVEFEELTEENQEEKGTLSVSVESKSGNMGMRLRIPSSEGYTNLSVLQKLCIVFAFFYILLIPVLIYLINRMVLQPLRRLETAMESLRNGDQDYRIPIEKEAQEFMTIDGTFNDMADRIQELKIANYEKELERQRVDLRNLQLQIRPHFLMNMFNLLFSFAQLESYQDIQKLSVYLSEYFRYLFQSGKDLQPFGLELGLIRKYLEIAALRYPGCFEVVYEIDEESEKVEVPPLLIHNFVENVFKHIVNYDKVIHLRIEAFTDEKEATFIIADDGPGMPPGMAEEINQGIFRRRENERIHVGIENSWKRLQYFYDGKGTLMVESEPGEGTCFTITIPLGGEENESVNCG